MKVRAQMGMVMNLDKCIGCHTCSVTCKNVWTNRPGTEYVWFNNVETKPGRGYPRDYEDQERWNGSWTLDRRGRLPEVVPDVAAVLGARALAPPPDRGLRDVVPRGEHRHRFGRGLDLAANLRRRRGVGMQTRQHGTLPSCCSNRIPRRTPELSKQSAKTKHLGWRTGPDGVPRERSPMLRTVPRAERPGAPAGGQAGAGRAVARPGMVAPLAHHTGAK